MKRGAKSVWIVSCNSHSSTLTWNTSTRVVRWVSLLLPTKNGSGREREKERESGEREEEKRYSFSLFWDIEKHYGSRYFMHSFRFHQTENLWKGEMKGALPFFRFLKPRGDFPLSPPTRLGNLYGASLFSLSFRFLSLFLPPLHRYIYRMNGSSPGSQLTGHCQTKLNYIRRAA